MTQTCNKWLVDGSNCFRKTLVLISVLSLLIATIGCSGKAVEEEEAHHIPDHLPADFDQAIGRIEMLVAHIKDGVALEKMPKEVGVHEELRDIVRWLPELAAKTDLSEAEWNVVDASTMELIARFADLGLPAEKLLSEPDLFKKIAELPQKLAEVRQRYRDMQIPVTQIEPENEDEIAPSDEN